MQAGQPAVAIREHLVALRPAPPPTHHLPPTEAERRRRRRALAIVAAIGAAAAAAVVGLPFAYPVERASSPTAAAEAFLTAADASEWGEAAAVMCTDGESRGTSRVLTRTMQAADLGAQLPSADHRVGVATEVSSAHGAREFRVEVLTDGGDVELELVVVLQAAGDYRVCGSAEPS
jgi:hypothetical protein